MPVDLWTDEQVKAYLTERIKIFKEAEEMSDEWLPYCTREERWEEPGKWAFQTKGAKKASKLFNDRIVAFGHLALKNKKGDKEVVYRPGYSLKCERYCLVKDKCNQFEEMKTGE